MHQKAILNSVQNETKLLYKLKVCLLLALFLFSFLFIFAQNQSYTIRGKVTDAQTGEELPFVTVFNQEMAIGVNSDEVGNYTLTHTQPIPKLIFRYVGFANLEIETGQRSPGVIVINVEMSSPRWDPVPRSKPPIFQTHELKTYQIIGHVFPSHLLTEAGGRSKLISSELKRYNLSSLQNSLNTLPGVRMDSRGEGGSRRLSIRGSILRSPFGVRNVKTYWNGIPLSSPDGSNPLEVIDPEWTGSAEVFKGPHGYLFGPGTGGAINFKGRPWLNPGLSGELSTMGGQYGMYKLTGGIGYSGKAGDYRINYARQENNGYRDQESNLKDHLQLEARKQLNSSHQLSLFGYLYQGNWELPGSLDSLTAATAPRSALPYSIDANAAVSRRRARVGLRHIYTPRVNFSLFTSVFANVTDKENPYGTSPFFNGYKFETAGGGGGRITGVWQSPTHEWRARKLELRFGGEVLSENLQFQEFQNDLGLPGIQKAASQTQSSQQLAFLLLKYKFVGPTHLEAGLSYSRTAYRHLDLFQTDSIDFSGDRLFKPVLLPRLGFVKMIAQERAGLHGSMSFGYSPPTLWEISRQDGSLDFDLKPEKGINYEIGLRSEMFGTHLYLDLSYYSFQLWDAILPRTLVSGETVFENTGQTLQRGVEAQAIFFVPLGDKIKQYINFIKIWGSSALQYYNFGEYWKDGEDLSGNLLTGVPRNTASIGLDALFKYKYSVNINLHRTGSLPLNDANTTFTDPYTLLNIRAGLKVFRPLPRYEIELFAGGNNLLNAKFSSFLSLNAFGGKYYNPSPGSNFFFGLSFRPYNRPVENNQVQLLR